MIKMSKEDEAKLCEKNFLFNLLQKAPFVSPIKNIPGHRCRASIALILRVADLDYRCEDMKEFLDLCVDEDSKLEILFIKRQTSTSDR